MAKQILRKASDASDSRKQQVARQTRAVVFLATPHAGAELASLVNAFRSVFGATVSIEDLREHDAHLRDLFDWYRNHAPQLSVQTVTYFELRTVKGVLPIVNPTSAHPGVGADPVGLDEDHLSIAKPREPDAQVCDAARDLLRNHVLASPPVVPAAQASVPPTAPAARQEVIIKLDPGTLAKSEPARIPRELPAAAYKFFGRQTELKQLTGRLRAGLNTAVVGPAGLGKTALAAHALADVVGANAANLAASPFPEGLVYLDLYAFHGQAEPAWNVLANRLRGADFMERQPARERAAEACRARQILVIIEGGEEADGSLGRATILDLFSVLSPENRWLLLTRLSTQAVPAEIVDIRESLHPKDAADLLDWLTERRPLAAEVRQAVLELLEGHPLALNWAGNLLARDEEDPAQLAGEWQAAALPKLSDPKQAQHTLQWLFARSVRGLGDMARQALAAAGLLARAPFPLEAVVVALDEADTGQDAGKRVHEALKSLVQRGLLRRAESDHWQFTHVLGYRFARDEDGSDPALRQRLGRWLHAYLMAALKANAGGETVVSLGRPLQHAAALLRADPDQQLWLALANYVLCDALERLVDLGRLELVKQALRAFAEWMERFPPGKAIEPGWQRERSVMLNRQGDVLSAQGDLAGALAAYREALAVSRRLAAADPSNAGWQRDLSVSQDKLGDVLSAQGDLAGALAAYRETLAVSRRLAAADPSNSGRQRDLSVSQEKLGDVLRDQGDSAAALAAYRESLAVRQRLAEADLSNAGWQRDLSVSHIKLGDVLRDQGDLAAALATYRESLAVIQRLAAADPSNTGWQRDLSVSHIKLRDVLRDQGDLAAALAAYREDLAISQRLAAADPSNAGWLRDLSVSHIKLGDVLRDQRDLPGALAAYRDTLAVRQRLAAADPSNAGWKRDLSVSHNKLGDVLCDQGDLAGALAAYREALAVRQRLAAADPSNAGWQRDLSYSRTLIGQVLVKQEQWREALSHLEASLQIDERLAALDPTNVTWQKDVQVSRRLVGQVRAKL